MDFLKYYQILAKKALADIEVARKIIEDELDSEVALFHLQQAVEKLLKALLSFKNIEFPKVHDLEILINICRKNNINFSLNMEEFYELSDYAVSFRYEISDEIPQNLDYYLKLTLDLKDHVCKIIFNEP